MFMLSIERNDGRMVWTPRGKRVPKQGRVVGSTLHHLPTGRRWFFKSRRAGMSAQRTLAALVAADQLSILPVAVEAA